MIDHHSALIYTMVMVSAVDQDMNDAEMRAIGDIVNRLPIFQDYDRNKLTQTAGECADLLEKEEGLHELLDLILSALPEKLRETAYALACDVAVADNHVSQEELRLLELIRHHLNIDRLAAAGIERGARARHVVL